MGFVLCCIGFTCFMLFCVGGWYCGLWFWFIGWILVLGLVGAIRSACLGDACGCLCFSFGLGVVFGMCFSFFSFGWC